MRLKRGRDDDIEDKGMINFYIVNKKYESMKQFFTTEMFKNLIVVIVLDYEKPENLTKSFLEWHDYCNKIFKEFFGELDNQQKEKIFKGFQKTIETMKTLKGEEEVVEQEV